MNPRTLVSILLLLTSTRAGCQGNPLDSLNRIEQEQIRAIGLALGSDDPVAAAWGAWLTGKHEIQRYLPALKRLVTAPPGKAEGVARFVMRSALDALIQMGAKVTAEDSGRSGRSARLRRY